MAGRAFGCKIGLWFPCVWASTFLQSLRPKAKTATINPVEFDCHEWVLHLEKSIFQRGSRLTKKGIAAADLVLKKSIAETYPAHVCVFRSRCMIRPVCLDRSVPPPAPGRFP